MRMEQIGESAELKQEQLFDKNEMLQDHTHQKGIMALEMSHLKASHSVANARTKVMGTAIQSASCPLLDLLSSTPADARHREAGKRLRRLSR